MHSEMKHLSDALTDNWAKLASLIKWGTTMCVVTLMKNGIWTFRRRFSIAEMGHWLEKMITGFALLYIRAVTLLWDIGVSAPHASRNKLNQK